MSPVMSGFPPDPAESVTLANWRLAPFNAWSFHHVAELIPSAEIPNDPDAVAPLRVAPVDLDGFCFPDAEGEVWTFDRFLQQSATDGLVIARAGRIIFEHYANGMTPESRHILMSVSKSILGLLAGVLATRGILDPAAPIEKILPEVARTAFAGATVHQLLDMRVGVAFDENNPTPGGPLLAYRRATNWSPLKPGEGASDLRSFFPELVDRDDREGGAHGGRFHYVSPNADLLGWAMERAAGLRFADLLAEMIWKPMGAARAGSITVDRLGAPRVAGGMSMTARDLARLGLMVAGGGAAQGRQIIPEAWLHDITRNGDPEAWNAGIFARFFPGAAMHYRAKWYIDRGEVGDMAGEGPLLFGFGVHGQNLFVDPARDLAIVKFSSQALPLDARMIRVTSSGLAALRRVL